METMLQHEYGLSTNRPGPLPAALMTLVSFIVIGFIPLMPFVVCWLGEIPGNPFFISAVLTAFSFFVVGAIKSRFVQQLWWLAGAETLGVGTIAAALAYLCGHLLSSIAT